MELFELVILFLIAVLVSSVLDEAIPMLGLPLLQIALGVVITLINKDALDITLDTNFFLLLFIAPLLYNETQHVDKLALWRNKGQIVSLAVGLVLVCALVVAFTLHLIVPSISLAAAFALGAALGPTDAAAVVALGKDIKISARHRALLSGEALINDASGVVGFQFAIAAVTTGYFSALDAGGSFCLLFFGGIAVGLVIGGILRGIKRFLRVTGLDNTTVIVVSGVLTPFILFMVAETLEVSGILAVVAGGLLLNMGPSRTTADNARANIVSGSVWEVLIFIINGVLFIILGMQLPSGISPTWEDVRYPTYMLIGLVLLITFVITAVRFLWLLVIELTTKPKSEIAAAETGTIVLSNAKHTNPTIDPFADPAERERIRAEAEAERLRALAATPDYTFKDKCKNALVTALAGPKGAVTMSVILTIPHTLSGTTPFPYRNMYIFLAAGVILCTLVLANFLLPLLAPNTQSKDDEAAVKQVQDRILRKVVSRLRDNINPANEKATQVVIKRYRERIRRLRASETTSESIRTLRLEVLAEQQEVVHYAIVSGQVRREVGQEFANKLKRIRKSVTRRRYVFSSGRATARSHGPTTANQTLVDRLLTARNNEQMSQEELESLRYLILLTERQAIDYLTKRSKSDNSEIANSASLLLLEHRAALASFEDKYRQNDTVVYGTEGSSLVGFTGVMHAERNAENLRVKEVIAEGYRMELELINEARKDGELSRNAARDMREEVYLLQMDASDALD